MGLKITELAQTESHPIAGGTHCTARRTVEFATGSVTLPLNCPVVFDDTALIWKPLAHNGAAATGSIRGFVWPEAIVLDSSDEVLGVVMMAGDINYGDINTADILTACGSISTANLKLALQAGQEHDAVGAGDPLKDQPSLRELGINVSGVALIR
jgi:hypothetical protein